MQPMTKEDAVYLAESDKIIHKLFRNYLDKKLHEIAIISSPDPKTHLVSAPHTTEARHIKAGQRVSIHPDGSNAFTVQQVLTRGGQMTFITSQGQSVDVGEYDPVYVIQKEK